MTTEQVIHKGEHERLVTCPVDDMQLKGVKIEKTHKQLHVTILSPDDPSMTGLPRYESEKTNFVRHGQNAKSD
jgi:hypothetical protein